MPIHMRRVGANHELVLDTKTDKSHLISKNKPEEYLFTFDSNGYGYSASGEKSCNTRHMGNMLVIDNDLGISVTPVDLRLRDCYFIVEADFLSQWLLLKLESDRV
jgi:hypothetical protein